MYPSVSHFVNYLGNIFRSSFKGAIFWLETPGIQGMENKETKDIRISARVPHTVKKRFVEKAEEMGLNETKAVLLLVDKFIKGEILPDSDGEVGRFERLEEEMRSLKTRLEQVEELRKGELAASAPM